MCRQQAAVNFSKTSLHESRVKANLPDVMDKIAIGRGNQQLGQFTEEEVLAGLHSGQFFLTDLWWKTGMEKWESLTTFPGADAAQSSISAVVKTPSENGDATIPWENESLGVVQRFWQTCVGIFTDPWETFTKMPTSGGYGKPLLFALVGMAFGAVGNGVFQFIINVAQFSVQSTDETAGILGAQIVGMVPGIVCGIPFAVAIGAVGLFIGTGIFHLLLMLFGAANRDYEATFRAWAYSNGLLQFIMLIPCIGLLILMTWGIVIQIVALKQTHRTDYWRVICAYFLPTLLCCGCLAVIGFMLVGALSSMDGNFLDQIRNAVEQATNE